MSKSADHAGTSLSQNLGLLLARVPLGAYLLFVGHAHFSGGLGHFAGAHAAAMPRAVPTAVSGWALRSVPVLELASGAFLVLGIFSRTGGLLASLALLTIIAASSGTLGRQGDMPFSPLLILAGFAVYLCLAGSGGLSLDRLVWGKGKRA